MSDGHTMEVHRKPNMEVLPFVQDNIPKKYTKTSEVVLPQTIIDEFARFLVPEIRKFYESEEGKHEFAQWLEKHKADNQNA